jgi:hypothetical protein
MSESYLWPHILDIMISILACTATHGSAKLKQN